MKQVNIYVRGICKNSGKGSELKEGKYIALLEYQNRHRQITGSEINTSPNRMILKGILEGLKLLKEGCIVNVYAPTQRLGFNIKSSPNRDLIDQILDNVKTKGHIYNEIESRKHQDYLIEELRKL